MSRRWVIKDGIRRKMAVNVKKHRKALLNQEDPRCGICGQPITHPKTATIDHIIPLAKGGTNYRDNTQLAHARCNRKKGSNINYES